MALEPVVNDTGTKVSADDHMRYLSVSALGSELQPEEIAMLAKHTELKKLGAGDILISEGDQNDCLYAIARGTFTVLRASSRGNERLGTLGPGMITGELAFLDGLKRTASVAAENDEAHVIALSRHELEILLIENPMVVYKVMRAVVRAAYRTVNKMDNAYTELMTYISG